MKTFTLGELKEHAYQISKRLAGERDERLIRAIFETFRLFASDYDEELMNELSGHRDPTATLPPSR